MRRNFTVEVCEVVENVTTSVYDMVSTSVYENLTSVVTTVMATEVDLAYTSTTEAEEIRNETCWNETEARLVAVTRYYPGYETEENRKYWWLCDYLADLLYVLDIVLIKNRVRFVKDGLLVVSMTYNTFYS